MADKTLSFAIDIAGASQEATELAKIELGLKKLTKERNDYLKLLQAVEKAGGKLNKEQLTELAAMNTAVKKQSDLYKEHKKVVDTAGDSLTRMRSKLVEMKKAAADGDAALNAKLTPAIKKLTDEVSKAEQAQGTFTRNVGNYSSAFEGLGTKIKDSFIALASGGAVIALATTAFNKMKEAVMTTTFAIDTMNQVSAVTKQLFYDIAVHGGINVQSLVETTKATSKFNEARTKQYKTDYEIGKIQREINALMLDASDISKSDAERMESYNKIRVLDTRQTQIETDQIRLKIDATRDLWEVGKENESLQKELYKLAGDLDNAYARSDQAMRRVASQQGGIRKRELEEIGKQNTYLKEGTAEYEKMQNAIADLIIKEAELALQRKLTKEEQEEYFKYAATGEGGIMQHPEVATEQAIQDEKDRIWEEGMQKARENMAKSKQDTASHFDEMLNLELDELDQKQAIADAKINIAYGVSDVINELAGKNKTLAIAAMAIEKGAAIAQIISNIAVANMKAIAMFPITFGQPWVSINTATGAISIAQIIAQAAKSVGEISKYTTGGKINRGIPINTGTVDNKLIAVNDTETVLTSKHVAMLGGSRIMKRIGVPGYAEGGYIGQQAPVIPPVGFDYERLARLIPKHIILDINKVKSSLDEVEIITTTQKI